ncbi:MAG TPA: EF-Tu/IF-2/RF-3 family GTPase [Candidatus Thermoplasmatota archaeon]|nr:EF-Tu/IF-2/RF-3 family GTPase [Candidatus Thermoplasmatota archaeon]
MPSLTVVHLGNPDYAEHLGKKSSESDVALRSFKEGDALVSVIQAIRYPEKPQPLAYAVGAADAGLLVAGAITKEIGEQILAADAAGIERGVIVLQNYLDPTQIKPLLKGTTLEKWQIVEDRPPTVRAALAGLTVGMAPAEAAAGRVSVDHHFNVKGVGEVALGFVQGGPVKKHDTLRVFPTRKTAQVRSIQVHDVDVEEAAIGDHVGLALKGVETADLDRGYVLAPEGAMQIIEEKRNFKLDLRISAFYKQGVDLGKVYTLVVGWQAIPVKIKAGMGVPGAKGTFEAETHKALTYAKGQHGILLDADAKGLRVVGRADLP